MQTKTRLILALMTFAMLQAAPALAVDLGALPPAQMENGIPYLTGGVGQPESSAMKAVAGRYSLALTFAERDSDFLNDIKVNITDRRGNRVLDIVSGPILLVDLPPGWYKVLATFNGKTRVRTVDVKRHHNQRLAYAWPNDIESGSEFAAFEAAPSARTPPNVAHPMNPPVSGPPVESSHDPIRHWDPLIYDNTHYYTQ